MIETINFKLSCSTTNVVYKLISLRNNFLDNIKEKYFVILCSDTFFKSFVYHPSLYEHYIFFMKKEIISIDLTPVADIQKIKKIFCFWWSIFYCV